MDAFNRSWSDWLWYSNNFRSSSLKRQDFGKASDGESSFPNALDLIWSMPIAFILVLVRRLLQRGPLVKLGYVCGVPREKPPMLEENLILERVYKSSKKIDKRHLKQLSKQTDMTERQIEIWFRKRGKLDQLTDIQRFTESSWHLLIRASSFIVGLVLLSGKPWFWDTKLAWIDWPRHAVTIDVRCYYIFELSVFLHFMFVVLTDQKRKDFWLLLIHHLSTVILMYFGWTLNFVRIGSLILLVHDASDPWVDLGKILVYSKRKALSEIVFVIFVFVWISTKDVIYPCILLYSTTFEACMYIPVTTFTVLFFNFFLYILMCLHLLWTYMILKVIFYKFKHGELKDVRSDSESETE